MLKKSFLIVSLVVAFCANASARGAAQTADGATQSAQESTPLAPSAKTATPAQKGKSTQSDAVRAAFDSLVDGIRRADAEAVMKLYWNSPQLALFNNNGTVTRGWEQAHSNRVSLYEKTKDVKLDVRDVRVKTLGPTAALVMCSWDQTQTADGQPEHATGRLTLVYQKVGTEWKIVHAHTSPDKPNPSNILPSERVPETDMTPTKSPQKPDAVKTPVKP